MSLAVGACLLRRAIQSQDGSSDTVPCRCYRPWLRLVRGVPAPKPYGLQEEKGQSWCFGPVPELSVRDYVERVVSTFIRMPKWRIRGMMG